MFPEYSTTQQIMNKEHEHKVTDMAGYGTSDPTGISPPGANFEPASGPTGEVEGVGDVTVNSTDYAPF